MKDLGVWLGVPAYLLLQWVAPLLSEFPEFFTATYWSRQGRADQVRCHLPRDEGPGDGVRLPSAAAQAAR